MTLDSRRLIVQVTTSEGATVIFTDAVAVRAVSQDVSTELGYLALRDFVEGESYSPQELNDDIEHLLAQGKLLHG